jgi:asparagine synthase (glutamine-hydrolysing)
MCGITCAVALRGHGPLAKERGELSKTLDQSLDNIKHRGPDAEGHWISEDCRVGTWRSYCSCNGHRHTTDLLTT